MWYDLKLDPWVFEIDSTTGAQIAERVVAIGRDLPAARALAAVARGLAQERMGAMVGEL